MCQRDQCFSMNQDGEHERDNTDIEHASTHEPATPAPATEPYSRQPNPLSEAPFLSRLTFRWPYALLKLGMQRPLEEHDLQENLPQDESTVNRMYLERLWGQECQKHPSHPSLHRALFRDFLTSIWYIQPMMAATATAKVIQAVALGLLIESFEESSNSSDGYLWAGVLVLCGVVMLLEHHHVFFFTWHKGMQYRIACVAAIYEKSLHLSSTSSDSHHHVPKSGAAKRSKTKTNATSSGKVINLATNDVERFIMASLFISYLWWAPIQSLAILGVGIWLLGPAFAAGFALLVIIFVPMQAWLSKQFAGYRSKIAAITDQRVTLVSQAVYGARVMKMSGWEWQFLKRIQQLRRAEVEQIAKANRLKAWNEALFFSANVVISVVIFLVHVGTGGELSPRSVFTVMTLINVVQLEMTKHVSLGVMGVSECYVSISRIQKFLEYPELPVTAASQAARVVNPNDPHHGTDSDPVLLSVLNMTCYWNSVDQHRQQKHGPTSLFLALSDISLEFRKGQLTCIIGTVGCGKSALLQALVGELPVSSGSLTRTYQTLSYAAQDPWIMDGTVRENIVMGMEWNEEWYEQVVEACGLTIDFAQFRKGDATIVGDRGVQCSGGQRARIGLARALYRDADVLICDDPLSAVDAKVGRLIYFEAIEGLAVSRGRCVVLATHQHQYLSDARCVLMLAGRVACVGSYDECLETSGGKLTAHAPDSTVDDVAPANEDVDKESMDMRVLDDAEHPLGKAEAIGDPDDDGKEANVTGVVQLSTFLSYARAMGGVWVGVSLLLLFAITQASVLVTIAVLGRWAERPTEDQGTWDIMGLVLGLACAVLFLSVLRAMLSFNLTVQASRRLHDGMAKAVLRAKIEFFDTNPLGRILNRFSADVGSNDDLLPHTLFDFLMIFFMVIGAVVTSMVVLPYTLVALVPLLWYFLSVRRIFVTTTRELKRLEGLARSPIFAMLGESLSGIATIRSNDALDYFRHKFEEAHDAHSRAFFAFMASSRWVGFRMDSLVFALLAVASFMSVLFQQQGWFSVDSAIMGLALSTLLQLAGIFQWCIRQSAEVVNQMVSVERVLGFENVPSEAPLEMDSDKAHVDKGWPREGTIEVEQLSVRYRASLPLSLELVSFRIPSGARVGVVGRTGSGKSTLVQSLFRLLEAEHGSVQLSGVDISTLGLHTVRTNMSVIPQVPVLFSGCSVRDNLDPFHKHTDSTIREALEDVHMAAVISELPHGWDSFVAEGGTNFSVGQRQLLCLARAILSKHRVLVLDEPTANVDRKTDQLLQEALQKSFAGATILSVAHRLDTVIDNDQILVLGNGHVLEYGRPGELLETSNGHFASMVRDTGETMSRSLRRRASELQVENEVKRKSDLTGSSRGLLDS